MPSGTTPCQMVGPRYHLSAQAIAQILLTSHEETCSHRDTSGGAQYVFPRGWHEEPWIAMMLALSCTASERIVTNNVGSRPREGNCSGRLQDREYHGASWVVGLPRPTRPGQITAPGSSLNTDPPPCVLFQIATSTGCRQKAVAYPSVRRSFIIGTVYILTNGLIEKQSRPLISRISRDRRTDGRLTDATDHRESSKTRPPAERSLQDEFRRILDNGAAVAERLDRSPPTKANRVQSLAGSLPDFASGNRAGRCRWSAGFFADILFPLLLHSGVAPFSPRFTPIASQDLVQRVAHRRATELTNEARCSKAGRRVNQRWFEPATTAPRGWLCVAHTSLDDAVLLSRTH
ncbi:hypothetical protein PR048_022517 [Dryococelus australis]|uniref:Uncharacterized protein n=1 Tax=Dryococelus australis TaxID=614101 RepID=A0ABQ9H176_9NEOP|nr:hypothetical protein PR048_022517 [Dryococelus australis]